MAKTKEQKRQEAEERQSKYNALTWDQKWELTRKRPGKSKKESENLLKIAKKAREKHESNKKNKNPR
tara:strand:- start:374 stop:574 length:201 start_codon:yes stop_codon:yes gene_type:complete